MSATRLPAIKVLLLPKDTNALGTIFGGVILSHIDLASAVEAERWGGGSGEPVPVTAAEVVLVAVDEMGRPTAIRPD